MIHRRKFLAAAFSLPVSLAAFGVIVAPASAQNFPERAVRLIVPFPAGGGTDLIARVLGQGLSTELGQPIIIDNRPGAGTIIGTAAVAK